MKKYIIIAVIAMAMVLPVQAFANYLITLKNGNAMVTSQYWEDGQQIKFYGYGGIAGVGKCNVRKIEQTTQDSEKEMISDPLPGTNQDDMKNPEIKPSQSTVAGKGNEKVNADQPLLGTQNVGEALSAAPAKEEKIVEDPYILEFENLKKEFVDIRVKETPVLYAYAKELTGFRDKILNERLGHVYSDQLVEIYSMLAEIESAVKSN